MTKILLKLTVIIDTCMRGKNEFQNQGKYTLVGVVSYGWGCASSTPGIYARVQGFLPWIKNLISSGECSRSSFGSSGTCKVALDEQVPELVVVASVVLELAAVVVVVVAS